MDKKNVEKIINKLEVDALNDSVFAYETNTYAKIDEYSIWKVPANTNLYYIRYKIEIGQKGSWGKTSETENRILYFRFQSIFIGNKHTINIEPTDGNHEGYDTFMEDEKPLFSWNDDLSELDRYKRAYEILMECWDSIPTEEKPKIHKQLRELDL